ncbi:spore wall protein 2-like [Cannabis sativa]|uniref:spore wall protein 2-like n=1 Tax=Cannabis sativa TaxID=3483 RepID=UPI0029CA1B08|nr:spore wall protein 2-like [Cannabis sativa]
MRPTAAEFKALKLSSFKFDTNYNSYKSVPVPEELSVAQSDIFVKLDAFSEKFDSLEVKIDLLHTSQQKISSDLIELKEFVSAQFVSFGAQMASMQTQFSTVFVDSYAKDKGSDSSNDDGGSGNEEDFDLDESKETDDNEEENVMGDEEGEGSEGEEKDGQADEDSESKEKNDKGSDDECTDSEEKVDK